MNFNLKSENGNTTNIDVYNCGDSACFRGKRYLSFVSECKEGERMQL